ncbi:MAG TPA: SMP-30/gluconolactonase/LRE family protein [Pirellulales bacterium]|jgi:enterochelin esterase-like enzyme|nr:SMP-30/gluconolactonase/LRE family protein [Pirellulales bacterium]
MRTTALPFTFSFLVFAMAAVEAQEKKQEKKPARAEIDNYERGPDSKPQKDVPKGKQFSFEFAESKIFPGTRRTITVYVPAQYKGDKPACVYVGLDRLGFEAPTVFDNLIHKGEMPVTIGIGVSPGTVPSVQGKDNPRFDNPRFNRSFEFDGMNGSLAAMIVDEIFPEVERRQTPDGLPIKLSKDPNDRCTGGGSTGGIGAFTLAWERPDQFRRVFSAIGTFVGMRGGDRYPVLVRKTDPKPIRMFQQDGENDQWMGGPEVGDWWMGNQTLDRALEFAGYDHQHVWGTGPHGGKHATAIFPDAMRYLWKDWPQPIVAQTARTQNVVLQAILDPEASWQLVNHHGPRGGSLLWDLAVNPSGEVLCRDKLNHCVYRLGLEGKVDRPAIPHDRPFAFNAEGRDVTTVDMRPTCVVVTHDGSVYATEADTGKVWLIKPDGSKTLLDEELKHPSGIALSPDGLWLAVMEFSTPRGYSYRVKADGTVEFKQRFYWAHVPDWADNSGAGSMCMDRDGRAYVATRMGVQVFDRNGRSRAILPVPGGEATSVCFGGAKFDTLYATAGGKLYQRKMKSIGAPAFLAPFKLPPWGGG